MKPSQALSVHREDIRRVVEQNRTRNPRVFGSVLHGQDTEDSDLDLLVDPTPETTLLDLARIQNRLETLLGVSVDVLTPRGLPEKVRDRVLLEAMPI
jgi:predicted nucleotidyltransferase